MSVATPSHPATKALKGAGLIRAGRREQGDVQMSDARDKQGGRKGSSRTKHRSIRPASLAIKGSSSAVTPSPISRTRRNAVSSADSPNVSVPSRLPVRTPVSSKTGSGHVVAHWREVVESRWDPTSRFLNLDNLAESDLVKRHKLPVPGSGGTSRDAAAIFKLAGQLKPDVQTLSLANNGLTGSHLVHLSRYLPKILNLSLANNKLRTWKDTDPITTKGRFRLLHLRELVLSGNPLTTIMPQEKYRAEMSKRMTTLAILDQVPLSTQIAFDVPSTSITTSDLTAIKPTSTKFPLPMGPSFIDGVVDPSLVSGFLARYFSLQPGCDEIGFAYAPNALFSFQINTNIPVRARIVGLHTSPSLPNQSKLSWSNWHAAGSRNMVKVQGSDKSLRSLHTGPAEICKAIKSMPPMKVDMGPGKSILDAFTVPLSGGGAGLMVMVHGEFVEGGSEGVRSFDRTFMLGAGQQPPSTSTTTSAPWPISILSDQLTIRAYSSPTVWAEGEMHVLPTKNPPKPHMKNAQQNSKANAQAPSSSQVMTIDQVPVDQRQFMEGLPPNDVQVILQLITKTRLSVPFAIDCLKGNAGDLDRSFGDFERVKATLPKEAFLP